MLLQVKTTHWGQLPWRLCISGHHGTAEMQRAISQSICFLVLHGSTCWGGLCRGVSMHFSTLHCDGAAGTADAQGPYTTPCHDKAVLRPGLLRTSHGS